MGMVVFGFASTVVPGNHFPVPWTNFPVPRNNFPVPGNQGEEFPGRGSLGIFGVPGSSPGEA